MCPRCEKNLMSSAVKMCGKCYRQKKRDEKEQWQQQQQQPQPGAKGVSTRPDYFARSDSAKKD